MEEKLKPLGKQSLKREQVAFEYLEKIQRIKNQRNASFDLLRNRTLTDYWDDSVKRFIQFKQRPAHKASWQANTASSTAADKLIAILSKLAGGGSMESQVHSLNDISIIGRKKERVLNALLKAASRKNKDDFQLVLEMFSAMVKGTVIGFEGWRFGKATVRDVTDVDPDTGELKVKEKTVYKWNDVWSEIVPIENFYPGTLDVRPGQIQDMADCVLVKNYRFDEWEAEFGKYPDADKVVSSDNLNLSVDSLFYKFYDRFGEQNEVRQESYFNQVTDELVLIANGIWINPMGEATVQPLPWNHKKLPFWSQVFDFLADDWFYGKSFPDKLISTLDVQDGMFDRILDQITLAIHKPIVTRQNATVLTKGFMHPGAVIQVKGSGAVANEFATVDVGEPSSVSMQVLGILEQRMERSTISSEVASGSSSGNRKTATQVLQEREAAVELVSLFLRLMEFAMREKNSLRLSNIIQFYTLPFHRSNKDVTDSKFRRISLREEKLSTGRVGTLEVEFTDENIPSQQALVESKGETAVDEVEIIRVSPSFIRDWEGEVEIIPATSVKQTDSVKQAFELNFQQVMTELYPDKVNRDAAFEDMLRVFKKDIKRLKAVTPREKADVGPTVEQGSGPAAAISEGLGTSLRQIAQP